MFFSSVIREYRPGALDYLSFPNNKSHCIQNESIADKLHSQRKDAKIAQVSKDSNASVNIQKLIFEFRAKSIVLLRYILMTELVLFT